MEHVDTVAPLSPTPIPRRRSTRHGSAESATSLGMENLPPVRNSMHSGSSLPPMPPNLHDTSPSSGPGGMGANLRNSAHSGVSGLSGFSSGFNSTDSIASLGLGGEAVRRSASVSVSYGLGSSDSQPFSVDSPAAGGRRVPLGNKRWSDPQNRRKLDVIAAGHASRGGSEIQVDRPGTILKMLDKTEREVYKRLKDSYSNDPVYEYTPEYHGDVKGYDETGKPVEFIRISNLLTGYYQPKVIDVKLGIRTFLESECDNPKPRQDLYKRMCELYPREPTPEEVKAEAITKHRWMSTRDAHTTISSLGFRIDGIAGYRKKGREQMDTRLAALSSHEDVCDILAEFAQVAATDDGDAVDLELCEGLASDVAEEMLMHLEKLYHACVESPFVRDHEFIGSSLLLIADAYGNAGVSWIDFAKTHKPPEGIGHLTHRTPWEMGNHEDGVLTGLTNLLQAWQEVSRTLRNHDTGNAMDSLRLGINSPHNSCFCIRWREKWKRKRRRDRANKLTMQSDMAILSALPAFQGDKAVADPLSLRRVVQMGADVVGAVGNQTLQLAQQGAGAAVAVTTRGVEAAGNIAIVAGTGVADAADAVRKRVIYRNSVTSSGGDKGLFRRPSGRKGTNNSMQEGAEGEGEDGTGTFGADEAGPQVSLGTASGAAMDASYSYGMGASETSANTRLEPVLAEETESQAARRSSSSEAQPPEEPAPTAAPPGDGDESEPDAVFAI